MAEGEEKSGLSRHAFTNEKEPEVSQAGWLHERASYNSRPPLSAVSPAQILGGMEQFWSYHMPHISAILGVNQVEMSVAVAMT